MFLLKECTYLVEVFLITYSPNPAVKEMISLILKHSHENCHTKLKKKRICDKFYKHKTLIYYSESISYTTEFKICLSVLRATKHCVVKKSYFPKCCGVEIYSESSLKNTESEASGRCVFQ